MIKWLVLLVIAMSSFIIDAYVYSKDVADTLVQSEQVLNAAFDFYTLIFIGSSALLVLLCFAWAAAMRSITTVLIANYFIASALFILLENSLFFSQSLLLGSLTYLASIALNVVAALSLICFSIKLFKLSDQQKTCYLWLTRLIWLWLLLVPMSLFLALESLWLLNQFIISITLVAMVTVGRRVSATKSAIASLFSVTIALQLLFNLSRYLLHYGEFSPAIINQYAMLSYWLMAIMMTYLIGRKYYFHAKDEQRAQHEALISAQASRESQKQLLTMQLESQEQLESHVQERTLELNIALQELEAANQELKEKNTLDELSGLYNRRYYDQKVLAEYRRSRRNLTPLSLVLIDIDHFKKVNDSYGHLAGDKCIVEAARMIKDLLRRSSDIGCRYGGEEFCLILPETDNVGALALAEQIRVAISSQVITYEGKTIALTVSCGITTYLQEKDATPETIFSHADQALYQAKQAGRNQVKVLSLSDI